VSYHEIAEKIGLKLCTGSDAETECIFRRVDTVTRERYHQRGRAEHGIVHWHERAVVKGGLRRFLILAAEAAVTWAPGTPRWARIWYANVVAAKMAAALNRRLPRKLTDEDRARVRLLLGENTRDRKEFPDEYRMAQRWAARS
jgi:hypothetical protein